MKAAVERMMEERVEDSTSLESLSKVVVHNDDITPYDFVIAAIVRFFHFDVHQAELITWTAYTSGQALVAVLPLDTAHRRVGRAHFAASLEGFPLQFTIESS